MEKQHVMLYKTLLIGILILFIGAIITPSISGNVSKIGDIKSVKTRDINNAIQTKQRDPHTTSTSDWWPMFHHDIQHSGFSTSNAPVTNNVLWVYKTGYWVGSSPAVADGKVYIGSLDEKVYCLDANTGDYIWSYKTDGKVFSSPAVADDKVYIGSDGGKVYCLDANTGNHIWNYTTGDYVISSPAVADGKIYIGSDDFKVYCLDANTGAYIWRYITGDRLSSSPAVADGRVYIGSDNYNIYAFEDITQPPNKPTITGQTSGKVGVEYEYTFHASDPDGDNVKYYIDWGDESFDTTPFCPSDTDVNVKHTWSEKGNYTITAYARDIYGAKGPEGTLTVTMPKSKAFNFNFNLLGWLFERFPLLEVFLRAMNLLR